MTNSEIVPAQKMVPAEIAVAAEDVLAIWNLDFETAAPEAIRAARDVAARAITTGRAAALGVALGRPAANREVGMAIAELLASFPQDKKNDLRTFSRFLAEDVAELGASPAALAGACKAIRRSKDFLPSIAEILAAVTAEKATCAARAALLARLPRRVAEADRVLGSSN